MRYKQFRLWEPGSEDEEEAEAKEINCEPEKNKSRLLEWRRRRNSWNGAPPLLQQPRRHSMDMVGSDSEFRIVHYKVRILFNSSAV